MRNHQAAIAIAAFAALLSLIGCRAVPDLPDLFQVSDYRKPYDVKLQFEVSAPVIVLGRVDGAVPVGRPKHSLGDPRVIIQLTRIRLHVEQVLKGTVAGGPLDFYYYTFARGNSRDLGIPHYMPVLDERRMFFLQKSPAGYRSVGDVADYTLNVRSGYHSPGFCGGKAVGCCIGEILLVPGVGYDPASFGLGITDGAYVAKVLCSRERSLELVQKLLQNPNYCVSLAAKDLLAPWWTYGEFF